MKLIELRKSLKEKFKENDIEESDVDFILAEVLGVKRTELLLINEIDDCKLNLINDCVNLRLNNMPVDKIFKKSYFYGLEFKVDENVLSPRPETELLVETAIKFINENNYKTVLDLCTGSGCIAISIKKNIDLDVTASDISSKALQIAKSNADLNNTDIKFIKSNMFEKIEDRYDLIVTNPPYIDSDEVLELDKEVLDYDPHLALDGGEMGLKYYNIIHDNLRSHLNDNGMLIMEIGDEQKDIITSMFNDFEFVDCIKDYSGYDRIIIFKK